MDVDIGCEPEAALRNRRNVLDRSEIRYRHHRKVVMMTATLNV